jgi:hypothetical protein
MNRIFKIILIVKLFLFFSVAYAYAVNGATSIYKVTMRKVELCTGSTGVTSCDGAVTIGSGDVEVDIASVSAGAAAASYGDSASLPLGTTYTHMRVTIDRKFAIKTTSAIDTTTSDDTDNCVTIATTDGMYVTDEATDKYTHVPVVAEGGTNAEMNLYLVNDQYTRCNLANCTNVTDDVTYTYPQGTGSSLYQTQHADGSTSADHLMIYQLSTPYTVTLMPPSIDISFGTSAAVAANEVNSLCQFAAREPVVTITIK